jgi:hypothetical protein
MSTASRGFGSWVTSGWQYFGSVVVPRNLRRSAVAHVPRARRQAAGWPDDSWCCPHIDSAGTPAPPSPAPHSQRRLTDGLSTTARLNGHPHRAPQPARHPDQELRGRWQADSSPCPSRAPSRHRHLPGLRRVVPEDGRRSVAAVVIGIDQDRRSGKPGLAKALIGYSDHPADGGCLIARRKSRHHQPCMPFHRPAG